MILKFDSNQSSITFSTSKLEIKKKRIFKENISIPEFLMAVN